MVFAPWDDESRDLRLERDGQELWNARAVAALSSGPWAWLVRRSWLAAELADALWALAAWLAPVLALLSAAFRGPSLAVPGMTRTRSLALRIIGVATIAAAVSWWLQVDGLVGERGISPASDWLIAAERYATSRGLSPLHVAPTWLWLGASDAALHLTCGLAVLGGVMLVLGVLPALGALLAFAAYLSLVVTGGVFMGYQWDALLLEGLTVAALLAPWTRLTLGRALEPGRAVVFLARLVAFKLYFMSGIVKLMSDDPVWSDLTALDFHWWTQPLPSPASWFFIDGPEWLSTTLCAFTLFCELVLPWALLLPGTFRRVRVTATLVMMSLQIGIMVTGNYGFFNLLSLGILAIGLDDAFLTRRVRSHRLPTRPRGRRWLGLPGAVIASALALLTVFEVRMVWQREEHPEPIAGLAEGVAPFRISNTYGLFARMTTERPEIEIQGSHDGRRWNAYRFSWKPDSEDSRPLWTGLDMPRLDWQLWFAALSGDCLGREVSWYGSFLEQLLKGETAVTSLLAGNPFRVFPPTYIRSIVWQYTPVVGAQNRYWERSEPRSFCPDVMLRNGRLHRADLLGDAAGGP